MNEQEAKSALPMDPKQWTQYTLTAIAAAVVALLGTYSSMTLQNSQRIAGLEADQKNILRVITRIEAKVDSLNK